MSLQGLKVVVELCIRAITCPGVRFAAKDDIYLSVSLLNQYRKSACLAAIFPLLFRMKMRFEKTFKYAIDPATVAELLECETVRIELIQLTPPAGEILASYEEDARTFLFPDPKLVPSFSGVDREILMKRNPNFAGISPRLEFSTKTVISECSDKFGFQDVKVMSKKRAKKPRQKNHSITQRQESTWNRNLDAAMPRARSFSPFRRSGSSSSFSETVHRHNLGSSRGRHSTSSSSCSPVSKRSNRSMSLCCSTFLGESRNFARSYSNHLVPHDSSSSDIDDLFNHAEELGQYPPLLEYKRSASSTALSYPNMTSSKQNSSLLCSPNVWEEVQERVCNLLTSPGAMRRLAYGATESEIDEVLTRRSISPHS